MKNIEKQLNSTLICAFEIQCKFYSHESKNNPHPSEISKNFEFSHQRSNKSGKALDPTQKQKPFSNG